MATTSLRGKVPYQKDIYFATGSPHQHRRLSVEEVKKLLYFGSLRDDELAWCEGMADWAPVMRVLEVAEGKRPAVAATGSTSPTISDTELGEKCFELAMGFQESFARYIQEIQRAGGEEKAVDPAVIWLELIYLGSFVVDFAIRKILPERRRQAVLSAYDAQLYRVKVEGVRIHKTVKNRFVIYGSEAEAGQVENKAAYMVGKLFAEYCGCKSSRFLINLGTNFFTRRYKFATQWLAEVSDNR